MSDIRKDDCIILNKCIYGIAQAARQYYKKAIQHLWEAMWTHASTLRKV